MRIVYLYTNKIRRHYNSKTKKIEDQCDISHV